MVRLATLLVVYLVSHFVDAQTNSEHEVTDSNNGISIEVTVPNVSSNIGSVKFALYQQAGFLTSPLMTVDGAILDNSATVQFENVPEGEYAIVCYHDKNSNNELDFAETGMPIEDYGATNNVYRMGPPKYEDAQFKVENKSLALTIKF